MKKPANQSENELLDDLVNQQLILQLRVLNQRLNDLESRLGGKPKAMIERKYSSTDGISNYGDELQRLETLIMSVNKRAARMRIDRQLLGSFGLLKTKSEERYSNYKLKRSREKDKKKIDKIMGLSTGELLICPVYPGGNRKYGGEFIQKRVEAYRRAKLNITVLEVSPNTRTISDELVGNVRVVRINPFGLNKFLRQSNFRQILVHQLEAPIWDEIKTYSKTIPIIVWVHGFEARRWQELSSNYSAKFLSENLDMLSGLNDVRQRVMRELFADKNVKTIFVSEFMKSVAEKFAKTSPQNGLVIHNSISALDFPYREKNPEHRHKILWIRSFAAHNYANDISQKIILAMSKKPDFEKYSFTIFGDGKLFSETVQPLRKFKNVTIENKFLTTNEIAEQHEKHGLILVPTRWDSQGLTGGEAMSSGLVPLTSSTAAIPEFMDPSCAIFARKNAYKDLVNGIKFLDENPDEFLKMSTIAAKRSQEQCGVHATIDKEIRIISKNRNRSPEG